MAAGRGPCRRALVAVVAVAVLGACAGGTTTGSAAGTSSTTEALAADGPLPFDLGPGIVAGGGDVVAADVEVPLDRFELAVDDPPTARTATAHRLVATAEDEDAVREAAAILLGARPADVDLHHEGAWFEFHAEGHGHDDAPVETTLPRAAPARIDEASALALTSGFLTVAGLRPAGAPTAFRSAGHLSVEAAIDLVPGNTVLRATASVTFGPDGGVIGGYGPMGTATPVREVAVVDVPTAVRRLALTEALAGYPTTFPTDPGLGRVALVSAELALSLREAVAPDGAPSGERWLLPVYRFADHDGNEWEVNAVAARDLAL